MRWMRALMCMFVASSAYAAPPNVLFIAVDDLRPELGCYVILDRDYLQCPEDRIARKKVEQCMVQGRLVYDQRK